MKRLVIGILAHVDAGKTTLSEAMLYTSGSIRKMGRVDNKDAFFDTYGLERERGITIFSKQAIMQFDDMQITLLDTPGHVDFSAEMERTLQVLDYAVLIVSGADGVQGHTHTLWQLLKRYQIPTFIFINKMDQAGTDKDHVLAGLKHDLDESCIDFNHNRSDIFYENIAMTDETALNHFLDQGMVEEEEIGRLIKNRKVFPCFFGSALKVDGVDFFLEGLRKYTMAKEYPKDFGAKIFKIMRDEQGNRLTYMKITGGSLKARTLLSNHGKTWEEKVNQIRIYSGEKYQMVDEAEAGCICAVTGLYQAKAGDGLGWEKESAIPILEPVLSYQVNLPVDCDAAMMLPKLRQLEEEDPKLQIAWNETWKEIQVKIMGEVQTEILKSLILERFGIEVSFGSGTIIYKETIANAVEGVGHFEPLKHYAEVHVVMEPLTSGSGLVFDVDCSEDMLNKNWQRLIMTHLQEREHKGVLAGSPITDMKITLVAGRAHQKHTEGGDFRQATYRAVRQGLKEAESVLLEPYYTFRLEVPENMIGRGMTDIEKMCGTFELSQTEGAMAVLTGSAPVATMRDYQKEVSAYTKGYGRLFCTLKGYEPCHNEEEVIEKIGYDSERDMENPTGSVFCAHGAGFIVPWDKVKEYMHIESTIINQIHEISENQDTGRPGSVKNDKGDSHWLGTEEVDAILERTLYANRRSTQHGMFSSRNSEQRAKTQESASPVTYHFKKPVTKEKYLLVDGYNVIFAWEDLKELAEVSIDGARGKLMDILCNYQAIKQCYVILVFDAYRVQGHETEIMDYHNIRVVYTKEAETADQYIEKFAHKHGRQYDVTVATSDGLEQIIIRGQGCGLLSARDLREEIERANNELYDKYLSKQPGGKNYMFDSLPEETAMLIDHIREENDN